MARAALVVRAAAAPGDLDGIGKIDPSYSTDRIYRVRRSELGFWLDEERVSPPVQKTYSRPSPQLSDRLLWRALALRLSAAESYGWTPGACGRRSSILLCQLVFRARAWAARAFHPLLVAGDPERQLSSSPVLPALGISAVWVG